MIQEIQVSRVSVHSAPFCEILTSWLSDAKGLKDRIATKKEQQLEAMSNEQILNELKQKHLPTFGTAQERKDRLRKHLGKFLILA